MEFRATYRGEERQDRPGAESTDKNQEEEKERHVAVPQSSEFGWR